MFDELNTATFIPAPPDADQDRELVKRVHKVMHEPIIEDAALRAIFKTNITLIKNAFKTPDFKDVVNLTFSNMCGDENISLEYRILWIRMVTQHNINITYNMFPWFRQMVTTYGVVLRVARSYKEV